LVIGEGREAVAFEFGVEEGAVDGKVRHLEEIVRKKKYDYFVTDIEVLLAEKVERVEC
jgi:hypothetical protein